MELATVKSPAVVSCHTPVAAAAAVISLNPVMFVVLAIDNPKAVEVGSRAVVMMFTVWGIAPVPVKLKLMSLPFVSA
jgi:hypothetical protein